MSVKDISSQHRTLREWLSWSEFRISYFLTKRDDYRVVLFKNVSACKKF